MTINFSPLDAQFKDAVSTGSLETDYKLLTQRLEHDAHRIGVNVRSLRQAVAGWCIVTALSNTVRDCIFTACVYGSTARGTANSRIRVLEERIFVGDRFFGSILRKSPAFSDLDIMMFSTEPLLLQKELTSAIENNANAFINDRDLPIQWGVRVFPLTQTWQLIETSEYSLVRQIFLSSSIMSLWQRDNLIRLSEHAYHYRTDADSQFLFEKSKFTHFSVDIVNQHAIAFVDATLLNLAFPALYPNSQPIELAADQPLAYRVRLPERPPSGAIHRFDHITDADGFIQGKQAIAVTVRELQT